MYQTFNSTYSHTLNLQKPYREQSVRAEVGTEKLRGKNKNKQEQTLITMYECNNKINTIFYIIVRPLPGFPVQQQQQATSVNQLNIELLLYWLGDCAEEGRQVMME